MPSLFGYVGQYAGCLIRVSLVIQGYTHRVGVLIGNAPNTRQSYSKQSGVRDDAQSIRYRDDGRSRGDSCAHPDDAEDGPALLV